MGRGLKGFVRSAGAYTLLNFLPAGSALLLTPLFTNNLANGGEYGLIVLFNVIFIGLTTFLSLGLDSAYAVKFFHHGEDPKERTALFTTVSSLIIAAFLIVFCIFELMGEWILGSFISNNIFTYNGYGRFCLLMALSTVLNALALTHYRNTNNLRSFAFQSILFASVPLILQVICIFFIENTAHAVIQWRSISSLVVSSACLIWLIGSIGYRFKPQLLKSIFRLSIPFSVYAIVMFLLESVDRLIVENSFSAIEVLSIYGLAVTIAGMVELVRASFAAALSPTIFQFMADKTDPAQINRLYRVFIITLTCVLFVFLICVEPLFRLLITNPEFHDSLLYIPLLVLAVIPKLYYSIYQLPLSFHSKVAVLPVINTISICIGVGTCLLLLDYIALYAVVASVFITRTTQAALSYFYLRAQTTIYSRKELNFSNETRTCVLVSGIALAAYYLYQIDILPFWSIGILPFLVTVFFARKYFPLLSQLVSAKTV